VTALIEAGKQKIHEEEEKMEIEDDVQMYREENEG
jgi:hypothetical protein